MTKCRCLQICHVNAGWGKTYFQDRTKRYQNFISLLDGAKCKKCTSLSNLQQRFKEREREKVRERARETERERKSILRQCQAVERLSGSSCGLNNLLVALLRAA